MSDESTAWRAAWRWASEWRGTISFWLTEIGGAGAGVLLVYLATDDWGRASLGLLAGPAVTFLIVFVWKWRGANWERRVRSVVTPPDPRQTRRNEVEKRFTEYYESQLAKLEVGYEELKKDPDNFPWKEFADLAWRTVTGLGGLSSSIGEYLTLTLNEENRQVDRSGQSPTVKLQAAWKFLEAMREAKGLFIPD